MTTFQREQIEKKIQGMEAGRFQELMLEFLPLYNCKYIGMQRNGHTESGKTKKGIPDLLKVLDNGDQIGCECGTQEDYWRPPKEPSRYAQWKPIKDAEKCLHKLIRPIELILASSQPIPAERPNTITTIKDYFEGRCHITLLASADISSWIEKNLEQDGVYKQLGGFFPEVFENSSLQKERSLLYAVVAQSDVLGCSGIKILENLKLQHVSDTTTVNQQIINIAVGGGSRFIVEFPGIFNGIKRIEKLPELLHPFGKIIQILGLPKTGKSALCWELVCSNQWEYKRFLVPIDDNQHDDFVKSFLIFLYSLFFPVEKAIDCIKGGNQEALNWNEAKPINQTVLIIDDAHLLSLNHIKRINCFLNNIKSKKYLGSLSVVFVTNKTLRANCTACDIFLVVPPWSSDELAQLVYEKQINIADPNLLEYFNQLCIQSGGHPLFAIALALKYPNQAELVFNAIQSPHLGDENLSKEMESFLYQDILTTSDEQNFVQRLAHLIGKADSTMLEAIRLVEPRVAMTVQNILDRIGGAILEGSVASGLQVNTTFSNIARSKIDKSEAETVYLAVAKVLNNFDGRTIYVNKLLDSTLYYVLAGDIRNAADLVLFLLSTIERNQGKNEELRHILLDKLYYFKILKAKDQGLTCFNLNLVKLILVQYNLSLRNIKEATEYLECIDFAGITSVEVEKTAIEKAKFAHVSYQVLVLEEVKEPGEVIKRYFELSNSMSEDSVTSDTFNLFPQLISRLSIEKLITLDYENLATNLFTRSISKLTDIAISLGLRAIKNSEISEVIKNIKQDNMTGIKLFIDLFNSSWFFHLGDAQQALSLALRAKKIIEKRGKEASELGATFYQFIADVHFKLNQIEQAIIAYKKSNEIAGEDDKFNIGWNLFKLGLTSVNEDEIENSLESATNNFIRGSDYSWAARAQGALASHLLIKKSYKKAVDIVMRLSEWFYQEKRMAVAPAFKLLNLHIVKVTHELNGFPLPESKDGFPNITPKNYLTACDSIQFEASIAVFFQSVASLAEATNLKSIQKKILKRIFYFTDNEDIDKKLISLAWYQFITVVEYSEVDDGEMLVFVKKLIQYQPAPQSKYERGFFDMIFTPFKEKISLDKNSWAPILVRITDIFINEINILEESLRIRWEPYLLYEKGNAFFLLGNLSSSAVFLKKAAQKAMHNKNWSIGIDINFILSFHLVEQCSSIRDLAQLNYDLFLCIEGQGITPEKINNLGVNMFRTWSRMDWRHITDTDIVAIEYLYDTAKRLKANGASESDASPIMVSSLLKCFGHHSEYEEILKLSEEIMD